MSISSSRLASLIYDDCCSKKILYYKLIKNGSMDVTQPHSKDPLNLTLELIDAIYKLDIDTRNNCCRYLCEHYLGKNSDIYDISTNMSNMNLDTRINK